MDFPIDSLPCNKVTIGIGQRTTVRLSTADEILNDLIYVSIGTLVNAQPLAPCQLTQVSDN